jgi:hypothetical protein
MYTGSADVTHVRYMVVHEVKAVKVQHGPKEAGSAHMYRVSGSGVTRKVLLRYNTSIYPGLDIVDRQVKCLW